MTKYREIEPMDLLISARLMDIAQVRGGVIGKQTDY